MPEIENKKFKGVTYVTEKIDFIDYIDSRTKTGEQNETRNYYDR
jgi:hypothetical protein